MANPYLPTVAALDVDSRARFISRTYGHLFGAVLAFTALEVFFFTTGLAVPIARTLFVMPPLLLMIAFVGLSYVGDRFARRSETLSMQYLGLAIYVLAEAFIFVPLLFLAEFRAPGAIANAALITAAGFTGLTIVVFQTRKDFSFLGGLLRFGFILAMIAVAGAMLFGFTLGPLFDVCMVALAGGAILYNTSGVLRHYPEDRYVAASLSLFADVALMFWYVLRMLMRSRN